MLTASLPVQKFLHFMETGGSLVCSQKPATCPYLELQDKTVLYELTKHLLQTHSGQWALLEN
jgi:hypothetical protein